jgi:hypothetical protein
MVFGEIQPVKEATPAIVSLPEDTDAIYFFPALFPAADTERIIQAPMSFSTPAGASHPIPPPVLVDAVPDREKTGNPSARSASKIWRGAKPADVPVETAGIPATLNRETAQAAGLTILDDLAWPGDTVTNKPPAIASDPEGGCRFQGLGCAER